MAAKNPILLGIISFIIQSYRIDYQAEFYSVDIEIYTNCSTGGVPDVRMLFQTSVRVASECSSSSTSKNHLKCENLQYGVRYNIYGELKCNGKMIRLSEKKEVHEILTAKYLNSTSTPTSIDTLFFLPNFLRGLQVEVSGINQKCWIEHTSVTYPFYNCSFWNLPSAQSFNLTYYPIRNDGQMLHGNSTNVYTELEELNFTCQLNANNQQIDFYWSNFTSIGYINSTLSISIRGNHRPSIISCDPYRSQGNCSTEGYKLEPGTEYQISAKLEKNFTNSRKQKLGNCSIKTGPSHISTNTIRHKVVDEKTVRITWSKHPFSVQARLRNLETNSLTYLTQENETSALFTNLAEASVYQVELNISKENYPSIIQTTNYSIQTNFTKAILMRVSRPSNNSLLVNINQYNSSNIQINYCIKQITGKKLRNCSKSNRFDQLSSATIYNVSVIIHRNLFENKFVWKNQTIFKLVNTNLSPLETDAREALETCNVKLLNRFPLNYSTECINNGTRFNCSKLLCGCKYRLNIKFDQTMVDDLCSSSFCDLQLNNSKFTTTEIQTPLETVKNLQIVNVSLESRSIEVAFDKLKGCYDQWILICESNSSKEQHIFPNSAVCTNLTLNETYRIYVETNRTGWETVTSNSINTTLDSTSNANKDTQKKETNIPWFVIPTIIGILVLLGSTAFLLFHRQRHRKQSTEEFTPTKRKVSATRLSYIVSNGNIFSNSRRSHSTNSKKIVLLSRPIRIQDLVNEYEKLIANDYYHASDEYEKLQNSIQEFLPLTRVDQSAKNRYKDIRPYEHTRVKLNPVNEQDSGYINASFINGLHNQQEYIACQGPLKTTINDHWRMIWEQNVTTIVMLTCLVERGTTKCEQYWPMEVEHAQIYDEISVCVSECVTLPTYDLRHIQLKKNDEVHCLKHYAFKTWDDHKAPTSGEELIRFIRLIRSEYRPEDDGPILVHCSAGVGRTGTYIALDRLIQQFDQSSFDGCLDIYGTVVDLRKCRDKMVQTEDQYLFIYQCLKEEYEKRSGDGHYATTADDPL